MRQVAAVLAGLSLLVALTACGSTSTPTQGEAVVETAVSAQPSERSPQPDTPTETVSADLPPHTVASDTDISVGGMQRRRVEIHVTDSSMSREDARRLIEAYRPRAGEGGQVSVRKPDPYGSLQPWAVDNMEGDGVEFNDALFVAPEPEPKAAKPEAPKKTSTAQRHYDSRDKYLTPDLVTAWTRRQLEAAFKKDKAKVSKQVWPLGKDVTWVEVKYVFPDKSWLFVGYAEDMENLGGPESSWRIQEVFQPKEAR